MPDFPILNVATDAINGQFEDQCPDCTVENLDLSIPDLTGGGVALAGGVGGPVEPRHRVRVRDIGDLATGLPEALASADLGDVKVLGHVPNLEQLQSLADGTSFAWIPLPRPESGWAAVDAMVRLAVGQDDRPGRRTACSRIEIWTTDNVPHAGRGVRRAGGLPGPVHRPVGPRWRPLDDLTDTRRIRERWSRTPHLPLTDQSVRRTRSIPDRNGDR